MKHFLLPILVLIIPACFSSKAEYKAGDCLMAADGYVLKVNKVDGKEYIVQGWSNHAWGEESRIETKILAGKGLVKIECSKVSQ